MGINSVKTGRATVTWQRGRCLGQSVIRQSINHCDSSCALCLGKYELILVEKGMNCSCSHYWELWTFSESKSDQMSGNPDRPTPFFSSPSFLLFMHRGRGKILIYSTFQYSTFPARQALFLALNRSSEMSSHCSRSQSHIVTFDICKFYSCIVHLITLDHACMP